MHNKACDNALKRIYPYLDGELNWYKRFQITRHLKKCPGCEGLYGFEQRLAKVVSDCGGPEIPAEALNRLKEVLKDEGCEGL